MPSGALGGTQQGAASGACMQQWSGSFHCKQSNQLPRLQQEFSAPHWSSLLTSSNKSRVG